MTFSSGSWTRKHIWTIIFTIIVLNCNHNHQTKQNKTRQNKTKQNKRFDLIWIWFRLKFWFYNLMIWFKTQYDLKRNKRQLIFKTHFLLFYFTLCLFFNKITHPCCQKTKLNTIMLPTASHIISTLTDNVPISQPHRAQRVDIGKNISVSFQSLGGRYKSCWPKREKCWQLRELVDL